ncbi:MAG: glucosyl transferase, partial [Melioribacteraceae bacterium]|nr:glucosyl transferase [Melioribacteraceae bacterium]MCF8396018.1 glucosyl transferase [Melioribacteraceae bacterium]MCF8421049.1 glucosyl transferase [Melioribacteraceae bacterium]
NGEQIIFDGILSTTDTIIYTDSLLPSTNYSLTAEMDGSNYKTTSTTQFRTMDTTSHDFTWQTWIFGEGSTSDLNDVAIIDENNIWVVGEIHTRDTDRYDSTGVWLSPYNAIHWDGESWEVKRILYEGGFWAIRTIYAFSLTDIWFSAFVRYNSENFNELSIPDILTGWGINKMWGTSSKNLYVVGNNGNVASYDGSSWQKLESGTELNIYDIWGNEFTNTFYCCATSLSSPDKALLKYSNGKIEKVPTPFSGSIYSVWYQSEYRQYIAGSYFHERLNGEWKKNERLSDQITTAVRGNDVNDIMVVGLEGKIEHYNGSTWERYNRIGVLGSVDIKSDVAVAVGYIGNKVVIHLGKR